MCFPTIQNTTSGSQFFLKARKKYTDKDKCLFLSQFFWFHIFPMVLNTSKHVSFYSFKQQLKKVITFPCSDRFCN